MTGTPIAAAVDVGSNSVHLLVARIGASGSLEVLSDQSVLLGLGDVVDRDGRLSEEAIAATCAALLDYRRLAEGLGAGQVTLIGTEPVRRAANAAQLLERVGGEVGLPLVPISERQEGQLTYLGVMAGRRPRSSLLVVDIGGGSSEVVIARPDDGVEVLSLPTGSARLSRGVVEHDPPTASEIDALLAAAHRHVAGLPVVRPARAVFVGGTATNLAKLAPLRRDGLAIAYRWLATLDSDELSRRFRVNLRRARQLPAGAAIVDALLAHFGLDGAKVSEASLRDGAILAAHRLGGEWPVALEGYLGSSPASSQRRIGSSAAGSR